MAFARAILKNPPILILDEVVAAWSDRAGCVVSGQAGLPLHCSSSALGVVLNTRVKPFSFWPSKHLCVAALHLRAPFERASWAAETAKPVTGMMSDVL